MVEYIKMKIAFCGDSFCRDTTAAGKAPDTNYPILFSSWPYLVAKEYNAEILTTGDGGKHFYTPLINALPKFKEADYIIMCVSEPFRIINYHNLPMNLNWVESMVSKTGVHWEHRHSGDCQDIPLSQRIRIAKAADAYYKNIADDEANNLLQIGLVSFIDDLLLQLKKKVIWFPCFKESMQFPWRLWTPDATGYANGIIQQYYIPKSGPYTKLDLDYISHQELIHQTSLSEAEIFDKINVSGDDRRNHFNKENNQNMARLIIDIIKKNNFSPYEIKMEDYFEVLKCK